MPFVLANQIVTMTIVRSVDAIGIILFERSLSVPGRCLRFNIDGSNFASAR